MENYRWLPFIKIWKNNWAKDQNIAFLSMVLLPCLSNFNSHCINSYSIIFQANECTFSCSDSHCCFSLFLNCRFYLSHVVNDEGFIIQDQYWKSLQIWHFLSPSYHSSNILSDLCSHNSINLYDWCYHIVF